MLENAASVLWLWTAVLTLATISVLLVVRMYQLKRQRADAASPFPMAGPSQAGAGSDNGIDPALLRTLIAMSSDFLWQTDEHHRFTRFARGTGTRVALGSIDPSGRTPWELDWKPFPAGGVHAWREIFERRQRLRLTLSSPGTEGHSQYFELVGEPILTHGTFSGYLGIGRDVTDRVEAEQALYDSQARYQDVIDSVREVVFRADADKRFSFLNRSWETITSYPVAAALGKRIIDFLHPDDRKSVEHQLDRVLAGELDEYRGQLRLPTRHGEIRWIEASARLVRRNRDKPGHVSLAGTLGDVSARRIAEMTLRNINHELEARVRMRTTELEASNRELEAFSYSVSHDLRAPLRSIDGFAHILEDELGERLDPALREHLERIRNATGRMAYLIDNLLELARLSRHALRKETVDLSELALQVVDDLRHEDPSRQVEVEITSDLTVTADKTLMRVVLDNLLRNAWKFSSTREVSRIAFRADRTGSRLVFTVSDNGVGFDMAYAAHLFRAFHRLHDNTEFPGSGIGLANVQRILQRHGGQIWASAAPDQGATFYFTLDSPS